MKRWCLFCFCVQAKSRARHRSNHSLRAFLCTFPLSTLKHTTQAMAALTHSLITPVRASPRAPVAAAPCSRSPATASLRPARAPRVAAPVRAARLARTTTVRVAAAKGYKVALLGAAGGIGQPLGLLLKVRWGVGNGRRRGIFVPPTVARVRAL